VRQGHATPPHLHRLGNDIVATYLIDTPEGITLVDAGFPGHYRDLRKEIAALGKELSDIASAILIDGILIRMVLLPGVMHLLGERAWWRRGGSASDRVPPDLDQRPGLAAKPIARR
jgi:hypothetical protein